MSTENTYDFVETPLTNYKKIEPNTYKAVIIDVQMKTIDGKFGKADVLTPILEVELYNEDETTYRKDIQGKGFFQSYSKDTGKLNPYNPGFGVIKDILGFTKDLPTVVKNYTRDNKFDPMLLIGTPCMVKIEDKVSGEKTYSNVTAMTAMPRGDKGIEITLDKDEVANRKTKSATALTGGTSAGNTEPEPDEEDVNY